MHIRDRIKELRRVPASQLRPNPKNWRTHPKEQRDALRGLLAEIGFAGAALARELADGSLMLIDGHARAEEVGDAPVPVLVLDVNEEEADKILATFDPLGAMAGADSERLAGLLDSIQTDSPAVQAMLDEVAAKAGIEPADGDPEPAGAEEIPERYQVLVECDDEPAQAELLEKLVAEGYKARSLIS